MKNFAKEFRNLQYILDKGKKILLFAHSNPDSDTVGSNLALKEYLFTIGKKADVACFDPMPNYLKNITEEDFIFPGKINIQDYDVIIACDSVERGFQKVQSKIREKQVTVLIDHHPDIIIKSDVNIIDHTYSSVCEIIYDYLVFIQATISKKIATYLMMGILGDTGNFQHSNTTAKVMEISSDLTKKGASVNKIVNAVFSNKKISTLKLWGRAFEKARISENGMIATVITRKDIAECDSSSEDVAQVASILNTVPGTSFSLILSEREGGKIKGSLRSEEYKGVDVSLIAHQFGGGGHKLASGFEISGKIIETDLGWQVV